MSGRVRFLVFFLCLISLSAALGTGQAESLSDLPPLSIQDGTAGGDEALRPSPLPLPDDRPFIIRFGDRNVPRIALTMDDCYEIPFVRKAFELCGELGIVMTFYPLGCMLKEEDRELWQAIADSGCEIGTHTLYHNDIGKMDKATLLRNLLKPQEILDSLLGYHYPIRSIRPPYGNIEDENGNPSRAVRVLRQAGFDHVVNWDVSQTDPWKALPAVRNGSILLYHARWKDMECISVLVPELLKKGFEFVTVSELLDFPPLATSTDLYTYRLSDYQGRM